MIEEEKEEVAKLIRMAVKNQAYIPFIEMHRLMDVSFSSLNNTQLDNISLKLDRLRESTSVSIEKLREAGRFFIPEKGTEFEKRYYSTVVESTIIIALEIIKQYRATNNIKILLDSLEN